MSENKLRFETREYKNWFILEAYRPKAQKAYACWWCKTAEQRQDQMDAEVRKFEERENAKAARREAKKKARAEFKNPYKLGDILYNSWGWEQTNIDFYQVVGVGKFTVQLRAIASKEVRATGPMSNEVAAVKDSFLDEPAFEKRIQVGVDYEGKTYSYIRMRFGSLSAWDGQPKYSSWYA